MIDPRDFEVTGGLSRFVSQGSTSPFVKNIIEQSPRSPRSPRGDILDTIQEGENNKRLGRKATQDTLKFEKGAIAFDLGSQFMRGSKSPGSPDGANSPYSNITPQQTMGKLISSTSGKKESAMDPLSILPSRIRGAKATPNKQGSAKPPRELDVLLLILGLCLIDV